LFVIDIDAAKQRVIVGEHDDLIRHDCWLNNTVWHHGSWNGPREGLAKIRYNWPAIPVRIHPAEGHRARLEFIEPQRGVTPGQAAVCFDGDTVLGGGWIERAPVAVEVREAESLALAP
jgi:tRNA-specific 2-thiouridylase